MTNEDILPITIKESFVEKYDPFDNIGLPIVLSKIVIEYLRYADYSDEEIRGFFPLYIVMFWRKASDVKDGMANGVKHSIDDLPIIDGNTRIWYKNGEYHRNGDKPAIVNGDDQEWYRDGKKHRDGDNPAYIIRNREEWYKNGKLHREGDLPAVIDTNVKEWYIDGKHHRDGDLPSYINGPYHGWYKNGKQHRDIIKDDGSSADLPAVIDDSQEWKIWYRNGKRHREGNLPAYIFGNIEHYFRDDVQYYPSDIDNVMNII